MTSTETVQQTAIELQYRSADIGQAEHGRDEIEFAVSPSPSVVVGRQIEQLQPADGGFAAWRVLIAAFVFEALLWGELAIVGRHSVSKLKF